MLIFAWVVLALSVIMLIVLTIWIRFGSDVKVSIAGSIPFILGILGCLWHIFGFTVLPYEFLIGAALGGVINLAIALSSSIKDYFTTGDGFGIFAAVMYILTVPPAIVFFTLAAVQHIWPHLITF